ncbi:MAG: alpha/beta hydrolase family protein [Oscillospiraceae bacterium]|nr:alpha/beta hydrolase family protein [Oscillospiraceae bacterium]
MTEEYAFEPFFRYLYKTTGNRLHFSASSRQETIAWQNRLRDQLKQLLGWPLLAEIEQQQEIEPLPRELWERKTPDQLTVCARSIATLPLVRLPFYVLYPAHYSATKLYKTVICLPAHGANKEVVAGLADCPETAQKLQASPAEAYGQEFCRRGYIAVCPDPAGFGARQEKLAAEDQAFGGITQLNPLGSSCGKLAETAEAFGLSQAGLIAWELRKLLDYLATLPSVDLNHLGVAGFSGGGGAALWLAALDPRINLAVISGYIHGYYDSLLDTHLCACNYVPGLWRWADMSDLAALIAPRALFIENGRSDIENGSRGIAGPAEQVQKIRQAYRQFGAEDKLCFSTPAGPHAWHATCYEFVDLNL